MSLIPTLGPPADTARLCHRVKHAVDALGWAMAALDGAVAVAENEQDEQRAQDLIAVMKSLCEAYHSADTTVRRLNALDGLRPEIRKATALRARYSEGWRSGGGAA
jgi:hypothetical protein